MKKILKLATVAAFAVTGWSPSLGQVQDYPIKPIRIVVGFSAGGGVDIIARALAERASTELKQSVIVDNRPGANGMIAAEYVARAPKDGYTLLFTLNSHVLSTLLYAKPTYRLQDFTPISVVTNGFLVLFYRPSALGERSATDVVANMHKRQVTYASYGIGSLAHLYGEQLARVGNFDLLHVAYKGQTEAVSGMMAGDVDTAFLSPGASTQFPTGRTKILAVAAEKRLSTLPSTPTFAEIGIPSLDRGTFLGLLAPAGTPAAAVKTWETVIHSVVKDAVFLERAKKLYMEPVGSSSQEFSKIIEDDVKLWAPLIKSLDLKLD
ncbi:Bug family tripartite tricarboxylate transporter substrate binding protein [Ottowia thiooxydans]|uniref:Tripartite-type tricarboxylate transporter receptor subunit TctC n=1 Tax=Ottowia thiooxydans TaxID=219182 RepID=A0ABV2QDZ5_9BURK